MQTFLPYPGFSSSAQCLDNRRLGKQRVEAKQIYLALTEPSYGWKNHPATRMWSEHSDALALYGLSICKEWVRRGFNDSLLPWFASRLLSGPSEIAYPTWLGDHAFHAAHRSNLLRKDPVWYGKFKWVEPNDLPYIWPV